MKKMLLATALALLITGCAQQTLLFQNKPAAVAPRKPSPIISSFSGVGRRKLSMQPKFVAAPKMLLKQKQQTFVNGLLGFYCFRHLCSRWKRVCVLTIIAPELPIDMANSISFLSLIYFWVPSSCFCAK